MKVLLVFNHDLNQELHLNSFYKGILKYKHDITLQHGFNLNLDIIYEYDIVVTCGFRPNIGKIHDFCYKIGTPFIGLADPFIKENSELPNCPYSIARNGIIGEGQYMPISSTIIDESRWNNFGLQLSPWKLNKNGHIVVALGEDIRSNLMMPWHLKIVSSLLDLTNKKIIIRTHPKWDKRLIDPFYKLFEFMLNKYNNRLFFILGQDVLLDDHLDNCYAVVSYQSNTLVESVIKGIPILCGGGNESISNTMGIHNVRDINNIIMPNRERWCHWLAWCQWRPSEMETGKPWECLVEQWNEYKK